MTSEGRPRVEGAEKWEGLDLTPHPTLRPPPLCGAIPASGDYVAKPGDKVAARVKAVDGDEQWILAEVVSYSHATNK